jgi:hypothetical protein
MGRICFRQHRRNVRSFFTFRSVIVNSMPNVSLGAAVRPTA